MFGDNFWENAILEATHWNYHQNSVSLRMSSKPPIVEDWWATQFNKLFQKEYKLKSHLPTVFIDTYYDKNSAVETRKFQDQTSELFKFARLVHINVSDWKNHKLEYIVF